MLVKWSTVQGGKVDFDPLEEGRGLLRLLKGLLESYQINTLLKRVSLGNCSAVPGGVGVRKPVGWACTLRARGVLTTKLLRTNEEPLTTPVTGSPSPCSTPPPCSTGLSFKSTNLKGCYMLACPGVPPTYPGYVSV